MKNFDDDFYFKLDRDEISTIFHEAKQHAETILHSGACSNLSPEDAKIMSTSFSIAVSLLQRYDHMDNA